MIYKCDCCKYSTNDKSNFNKHNVSRKHKLLESKCVIDDPVSLSEKIMELTEMMQLLKVRLDNQETQINEQKKQIEYINSEIF